MPLSSNPKARASQLRNLRPGSYRLSPAAKALNKELKLNQAISRLVGTGSPSVQPLVKELASMLEESGHTVTTSELPSLTMLAISWQAMQACQKDVARFGAFTKTGEPRPSFEMLRSFLSEVRQQADAMGLSPKVRAKLGIGGGDNTQNWLAWITSVANPKEGE